MCQFHRRGSKIEYKYKIGTEEKISQMKDLGIILDEKLSFKIKIQKQFLLQIWLGWGMVLLYTH